MKKSLFVYITFFCIFILGQTAYASPRQGYVKCASYRENGLTITSFSENWGQSDLTQLYAELMNNYHGNEIKYLRNIYIYPDSPDNVEGYYIEDIRVNDKGSYVLGGNSYIELFGGDVKTEIEEIAPVLSHEYGHHYTIFNMMIYESRHYNNWADSQYAKLRGLSDYPVIYGVYDENYKSHWDICEIAANDYVQLLGSDLAKKSHRYLDAKQLVEIGSEGVFYERPYFNSRPQQNLEIPLAAQVDGLFEYFLEISRVRQEEAGTAPYLEKLPQITAITAEKAFINKTYTLKFEEAKGNGPFEYTIVMYSLEGLPIPTVVKTLNDGQILEAVFGTILGAQGERRLSVLDYYAGEYRIYIFAKDYNGFIYSSDEYIYDFGDDYFEFENYYSPQFIPNP